MGNYAWRSNSWWGYGIEKGIDILTDELVKYKKALENGDHEEMYRLLDEGRRIKEEVDG